MDDLSEFIVKDELREIEFTYRGKTVKVRYVPVTRGMRQAAIDKATWAYYNDHKHLAEDERIGSYTHVIEKELAASVIRWWNLPRPPREIWDRLEAGLGDRLVEELRLMTQVSGRDGTERGKNSPAGVDGDAETAPTPATSETSNAASPTSSSTAAP